MTHTAESLPENGSLHSESPAAQLIALTELSSSQPSSGSAMPLLESAGAANPLHQIRTKLTVCVGCAEISVGELLAAREHQVLCLDHALDQPVDLLLEGQVVARGQLVAVDEHFAVRITELPFPLKV